MEAKVFARVSSHHRRADTPVGSLVFVIEYLMLDGRPGGKVEAVLGIVNDAQIVNDLQEVVAQHLSEKYPGETFRPKNVAGLGL
jgi:hypothetical protein